MSNVLGELSRLEIDSAANPRSALYDQVRALVMARRPEALTPAQRQLWELIVYDSEVKNGGHFQYFHNQGLERTDRLMEALGAIGALCQRRLFEQAIERVGDRQIGTSYSVDDYDKQASAFDFDDLDDAYYECSPDLEDDLLPDHVLKHVEEYVQLA